MMMMHNPLQHVILSNVCCQSSSYIRVHKYIPIKKKQRKGEKQKNDGCVIGNSFSPPRSITQHHCIQIPNETEVMTTTVSLTQQDDEKHIPPLEEWPQRPFLLNPATPDIHVTTTTTASLTNSGKSSSSSSLSSSSSSSTELNVTHGLANRVFDFETELFKGRAMFRFKGIPTTTTTTTSNGNNNKDDNCEDHETRLSDDDNVTYFRGKKRKNQIIIQGQFKVPGIPVSDLHMGSEFTRPYKVKTPMFIQRILQRLLGGHQMTLDLCSSNPVILFPLLAGMQTVRADPPGQEPHYSTCGQPNSIVENGELGFGPNYTSKVQTPAQRKKFMSKYGTDETLTFDPNLVYTFEEYTHTIHFPTYQMDFGLFRCDLTSILNHEPLQVMAKCTSRNQYLWRFELWHEKLMENNVSKEDEQKKMEKLRSSVAMVE